MNESFLCLNVNKTKITVKAPASVKREIPINGTLIYGECIRFVDSANKLGVVLDTELSFAPQINKVVSSCLQTIRDISKIKKFLNEHQLKNFSQHFGFCEIRLLQLTLLLAEWTID